MTAGILLGGTAIAAFGSASTPRKTEPTKSKGGEFRPTTAEYARLAIRPAGQLAPAEGIIEATGLIDVDADHSTPVLAPYSGQVTRVLAELGRRVMRGEPLLEIRATEFVEGRDALVAAVAQHQTALAQLRAAEATAQRQAEIYKTAGGALKDYQQARNELVAAHGAAKGSAAALSAARGKLTVFGKSPDEIARLERGTAGTSAETMLRAPISGIVAERTVASGQWVGAGGDKPLFVVTDPSNVWLVAQIPESNAGNIHLGDRIEVTTPAWPGRRFDARITQIGASLDPDTHRLPVRATITNADGALKPRMFASFTIRSSQPSRAGELLIPASAVIYEGDEARVWVAGTDRTLRPRSIKVADRANGMVRVVGGLRRGERIATAGTLFVNEAGSAG
ncbi:efflux RND transporter periplasmic adaptor subunit [Sphingomonas koreensis]